MSLLLDLSDDRRDNKPWLPDSDQDVTEGRVIKGSLATDGKPVCILHGAMNCVSPSVWRCSEFRCGVGAQWFATNSPEAKRAFSKAWDERVRV